MFFSREFAASRLPSQRFKVTLFLKVLDLTCWTCAVPDWLLLRMWLCRLWLPVTDDSMALDDLVHQHDPMSATRPVSSCLFILWRILKWVMYSWGLKQPLVTIWYIALFFRKKREVPSVWTWVMCLTNVSQPIVRSQMTWWQYSLWRFFFLFFFVRVSLCWWLMGSMSLTVMRCDFGSAFPAC